MDISTENSAKMYKVQRFCNSMRVYEEFCKVTKVGPDWCSHAVRGHKKQGTGDFDDPLKTRVQGTLKFDSYSNRKEIYDGSTTANDERFN